MLKLAHSLARTINNQTLNTNTFLRAHTLFHSLPFSLSLYLSRSLPLAWMAMKIRTSILATGNYTPSRSCSALFILSVGIPNHNTNAIAFRVSISRILLSSYDDVRRNTRHILIQWYSSPRVSYGALCVYYTYLFLFPPHFLLFILFSSRSISSHLIFRFAIRLNKYQTHCKFECVVLYARLCFTISADFCVCFQFQKKSKVIGISTIFFWFGKIDRIKIETENICWKRNRAAEWTGNDQRKDKENFWFGFKKLGTHFFVCVYGVGVWYSLVRCWGNVRFHIVSILLANLLPKFTTTLN